MILSMTGFANSIVEIPLSHNNGSMILSISLKSLNSRYFELNCKLPSMIMNLEVSIQRLLQKELHRGHVSLHIKNLNSEYASETIKPALKTIQNYISAITTIQNQFGLQDQITLAQILQLPHALQSEETQLHEEIETKILHAIKNVALQLIETQKKEGLQLAHDIQHQLSLMESKIEKIKTFSLQAIQEKKNLLHNVLQELSKFDQDLELKTTEQCLLEARKTTLMYEIEKIDINEETVRFNAHLKNLLQQFQVSDPAKGKKIDFIIQELNREINTIASKCSNIDISTLAIDVKADLEKAREQAQNII